MNEEIQYLVDGDIDVVPMLGELGGVCPSLVFSNTGVDAGGEFDTAADITPSSYSTVKQKKKVRK